jgi:hypothetical protein
MTTHKECFPWQRIVFSISSKKLTPQRCRNIGTGCFPLSLNMAGSTLVGGQMDAVEGSWRPAFPVLIEFPSLEQAHRWYDSEEYRELKELRLTATKGHAVFMAGVAI